MIKEQISRILSNLSKRCIFVARRECLRPRTLQLVSNVAKQDYKMREAAENDTRDAVLRTTNSLTPMEYRPHHPGHCYERWNRK